MLQSPSNCGCFSTEIVTLLLLLADDPIPTIFNNYFLLNSTTQLKNSRCDR